MLTALLDCNICADIVDFRLRYLSVRKTLSDFDQFFISSTTFSTLFYILRKSDMTKDQIFKSVKFTTILPPTQENCLAGYKLAKTADEVEDCIELMIAKDNGLTFVTADKDLVAKYHRACKMILVE